MRKKQDRLSLCISNAKRNEIKKYCEFNHISMSDYFVQMYEQDIRNSKAIIKMIQYQNEHPKEPKKVLFVK